MKNNEVFNEIRRTATEWETAKRERSERKKAIIKEFGYDSPEYAAWSESDTETPFPISHGAMKAYHAWRSNNENETEEFEFNDFTWETETKDFIDTLRKAGIETMIITNASTALLENLHAYAAEGCTLRRTEHRRSAVLFFFRFRNEYYTKMIYIIVGFIA